MAPRNNNLPLLLDGPKALLISGVSDDSTDGSKPDRSTRKFEQRNDCTRYERVFRLEINVVSTQTIARSGEGGEEPAM